MSPTIGKQQGYYFSDKLKAQLSQISQYPLTVIEAPGGFGKTTAVREYLKNELSQADCVWYTCLGEPLSLVWAEICALFSGINSQVTDGLRTLKAPTMDGLLYIRASLKKLRCRRETYVVIDNYQLVHCDLHRELLSVFSMHENPDLHMIFITQQLGSRQPCPVHNDNICTIDAPSFFFDREGVASLFRMEGFRLTNGELDSVFRRTEGWISAIRLQMLNYRETGAFVFSADIEQLVETTIWNRLTPAEKDFLLTMSIFDSFTARQAAAMLDYDILPGEIEDRLKISDFIRFLPDKRLFVIHSILLDYLRNRFYYRQPRDYQNEIFRKAALSCAAMGQYCPAARFFYQIGDFEAILSLPFTHRYLDARKEDCEEAFLVTIMGDCPEDILRRHPLTTIVFAHYALLNGEYGLYERLCGLLRALLYAPADLPREQVRRLTGEFILLESLGNFSLSKMREGYEAARAFLEASPHIVENSIPWLSVFPTALGMFWHESGQLDGALCTIDALKPVYRQFNHWQGAGLGHLVRAEAMLARGADNEAEILCYKALYEARAHRQSSICIYAELCLARIFMLRGDAKSFFAAVESLKSRVAEPSDADTRRMAELCLSIVSLLLGTKDHVALWLYDIEGIRKSLYAPTVPFAELLYFRLLLLDRRYDELYTVGRLALDALQNPRARVRYLLPQVYCLIFFAVAKHNNGDAAQARRYVERALDLALPDGVLLPFADHECIAELLPGGARCAALSSLCRRQANGVSAIKKAILQNKSLLTLREREIAALAKRRLSAKEIAAKLYISEKTVKSTLGSVYSKLGIHSRGELMSREF